MQHKEEPNWLKEIRQAIPIRFIETQRLLNSVQSGDDEQTTMTSTVSIYSEELAETIKTKLAESTALSQSLDRTFPKRLVSHSTKHGKLSEPELRSKLNKLEAKRSALMDIGLLKEDNETTLQAGDSLDDSAKVALSVYVEDTEQKLGIFDELANKINLLKRIINKRFLYKEMAINQEEGFVFINPSSAILPLTSLSSGEQHELVLFYELLFKAQPGSLILIDEPEISLHTVWQEHFLEDLQEITQLAQLDALIATHSPDIISDRRDLVAELEEPNNGRLSRV